MFYVLLLVLSTLLSLTNSAYAATYWVAKTGSNSNSCAKAQSQSTPKLTIAGGITCLSAGDTLMVRGGTYHEQVGLSPTIPGGTSWSNLTTVKGVSGEQVTFRGLYVANPYTSIENMKIDGLYNEQGDFGGVNFNASHIRLQNMEITGAKNDGVTSSATPTTSDIEFINVYLHDIGIKSDGTVTCEYYTGERDCQPAFSDACRGYCHGTYFNGDDFRWIGGRVEHCEGYGIHNTCTNCRYDGIVFSNNHSGAIIFRGGSNSTAVNNVVANNTHKGFLVAGSGHAVYHNTFYGNGDSGAILCQAGSFAIKNNIFFNNSTPMTDCTGDITNNLTTNPSFVNAGAGNFHLQSGSAAINAGQAVSEVTADFDGNSRPQGPGYDIGAYEYSVGPLPLPSNLRIVIR